MKNKKAKDIVHQEDGKWYFWDETWADRHGPFETKEEADKELDKYVKEYLGE